MSGDSPQAIGGWSSAFAAELDARIRAEQPAAAADDGPSLSLPELCDLLIDELDAVAGA